MNRQLIWRAVRRSCVVPAVTVLAIAAGSQGAATAGGPPSHGGARAVRHAPRPATWNSRSMLITSQRIGAVRYRALIHAAERAAGVKLMKIRVHDQYTQCESAEYGHHGVHFTMQADPGRVDTLFVDNDGRTPRGVNVHTWEGIHLGSTLAQLKRAYPHLKRGSGYDGNQPIENWLAKDHFGAKLYFATSRPYNHPHGADTVYVIAVRTQPPHHLCGGA